jgi:hypothetical protein
VCFFNYAELVAYKSVVSAVRASGPLDERRRNFIGEVRTFFDVTEDRHAQEVQRAASDSNLRRIAER